MVAAAVVSPKIVPQHPKGRQFPPDSRRELFRIEKA
jgi:hypothetical protein